MSQNDVSTKIYLLTVALTITGCGADPFSKLISNKLRDDQAQNTFICPSALAVSTLSAGVKNKVQIGNLLDENMRTLGIKSSKKLKAGKTLVATYSENCLDAKDTKISIEEFTLEKDQSVEELEIEAQSNPCLLKITESFKYKTHMMPNDANIGLQKHLDAMKAFDSYDIFYGASGITKEIVIAIVDSGVDIDHEDIAGNVWHNVNETPGNGIDDDKNGFVDDYEGWNFAARTGQKSNDPRPLTWKDSPGDEAHGTHVAGLAAAEWDNSKGGAGVMGHHVKIMAINVFGDSSDGSTAKLNQGIKYAADNHADIINLSLGACGYDRTTYDTILYAICKGSTVISAAGNTYYINGSTLVGRELSDNRADENNSCATSSVPASGAQKFYQTPASFGGSINGLITVGSSDSIPNASGQYIKSDFSAWSSSLVELAAPGSQNATNGLYSSLPSNSYGREEGTSMATPVVSGAAALAKSYAATKGVVLTPMALEKLLENSARIEPTLNTYVKGGKHLDLLKLANEINTNINSYR